MAVSLLIAASPAAYGVLALSAGLFLISIFVAGRAAGMSPVAWLSSRERGLRRARRLLSQGDWQPAFTEAGKLRDPQRPDPNFERRLLSFEGDCLYRGAERSLQLSRYAEALELMRGAGDRLGLPEEEFDKRILSLLLAEIRRRMTSDPSGPELPRLVNEAARVGAGSPEASFWLALHHLHVGNEPAARDALHDALAESGVADPGLYLGVLCRRAGQPADALRWLGRALGAAPECPVIQWHFAAAALDAGTDLGGAVRTLEKVTGPDGLAKYVKTPQLMWTSLGPRSWLAALVRRAPVPCPLGLDRVDQALSEARRVLAAGLEKCDRGADAVAVYYQAFSAGDDSLPIRKGLGLSLARAGLYDDALPHLQAARDLEQPPTPLTVGYLALSTARAKAASATDRADHVRIALTLLTEIDVHGDPEWTKLARELAGEAKDAGVELTSSQKMELARAFASIDGRDPVAIDTYNQLAGAGLEIPHEVAVVYVRAAAEGNVEAEHDLVLFDRAFRDRDGLRRAFQKRQWDPAAAESLYLARSAKQRPGRYPEAPGPLYAATAERLLLDEHRRHATAGRPAEAWAALQLAASLGPHRALTLDRLAEAADSRGDRGECLRYLALWEEKHPHDGRARARRALLDFQAGQVDAALEGLTDACAKSSGPQRVRLLCVTARVALAAKQPDIAIELFDQARLLAPHDPEPITGLAALSWQRGDYDRLATLAPLFDQARNTDPFRALLACLAFALAGDEERSEAEFAVAAAHPPLGPEAAYLRSILLAWQNRMAEARAALDDAVVSAGPTRDHVQALRGQLAWQAGDFAEAVAAWDDLSPERRSAWQLDRLFPAALFLGGIGQLANGRETEAVETLRHAREAGFLHPKFASIEAVARQRAAQAGSEAVGADGVSALQELEVSLTGQGDLPANTAAWLARGYRKQGDLVAARRVLHRVAEPTAHVWLQKGLLALSEGELPAAEAAFLAAKNRAPDAPAVAFNLAFTRLSLGLTDSVAEDVERAAALHPSTEVKRMLNQLAALAPGGRRPDLLTHLTAQDDQRLIKRFQQFGQLDTAMTFLSALYGVRSESTLVRQAYIDLQVLWVHRLIDRGEPELALAAVGQAASGKALSNLLGVASAMCGHHPQAASYFQGALPGAGDDARVQQNLALISERLGDAARARIHWQRFLTSLPAHCPAPPGDPTYLLRLGELVRRRIASESAT